MAGTRLVRAAVKEGMHVDDLRAESSKTVRAALAAKWVAQGRVWFPEADPRIDASREPLLGQLLTELRQFPSGRHDDFVDTLAYGAAVAWDHYVPPDSGRLPVQRGVGEVVVETAVGAAVGGVGGVGDWATRPM